MQTLNRENTNLILKFQMAGETDCHLDTVARLTIDGKGGLTVYDSVSGAGKTISLEHLELLSIRVPSSARQPA